MLWGPASGGVSVSENGRYRVSIEADSVVLKLEAHGASGWYVVAYAYTREDVDMIITNRESQSLAW